MRPTFIDTLGLAGFIGKSMIVADNIAFDSLISKLRPMIDEICCVQWI